MSREGRSVAPLARFSAGPAEAVESWRTASSGLARGYPGTVTALLRRSLELLAFAAALLLVTAVRESESPAILQAVVWLPTGIAIAGLWLLGLRAVWVVAAATFTFRLSLGYPLAVVISTALGSAAEATLGVLVMRRLGLRGDLARLRDTVTLFTAAAIAPLASIFLSWISRQFPGVWRAIPFYSGWDGWWRMNALGALTVVPLVLTWLCSSAAPIRRRALLEGAALLATTLGVLSVVMTQIAPSPTAIMLLYLVLPVVLLAALRLGQRGAATTASIGSLFVAILAAQGIGPFQCIPIEQRHDAIQIFGLTLIAMPLVIGSLVAERELNLSGWLQSEGLRDALMKVLPDVSYRLRIDGTFLEVFAPEGVNAPRPLVAFLGKKVADLFGPHLAARMQAAIELAHRGTRPEPLEYTIDTADGPRVREARYVHLADQEVLCVVRDITEQKRAKLLLAWQAEILAMVAEARPSATIFTALVHGLESLLEHGTGSLLLLEGRQLHLACAPGLPAAYNAAIDGFAIGPNRGSCGTAAHENRTVIVTDITTDPLWVDFRDVASAHGLRACWSVPVRSPTGAVIGTFAIYHTTVRAPAPADIAIVERAAVLAGLAIDRERRENLLTSINRNVSEGLYRSLPDRGIVYTNDAFAHLLGYGSPEELLRAVANGSGNEPQHAADLARFTTAMPLRGPTEVLLHRRDGSTFWGLLSQTAVHGPDGAIVAWDGALADLTAQKGLEEQLRQAQKMEAIGKLAGGVAHDFNNLLTAIAGYAEAVREQVPEGEPRNDVDEILNATERASGLTRQLLAFSRQQVLSPQVLDLAVVVDKLGSLLRRLIGEDVGLITHYAPGPSCVRVDRGQLEQVLLNLVVNARDAMADGGKLTIATTAVEVDAAFAAAHVDLAVGPYVALSVRDNGVGMSGEVVARAFDPFFTTKELGKGTGLGLSTVYGIVKQSGGAVWIDSVPAIGTTVWIYLPRVPASAEPEKTVSIPRPHTQQATVLIAEDEQLVRDLVHRILARAGYQVLAAADGPAAIAMAQSHRGPIDALITDAVMPHMSGRELASRLLATRPGLPVLFMSGYASDSQHLVATVPGAASFLQKPFDASRLLEQVGALIERARLPHREATLPGGRA